MPRQRSSRRPPRPSRVHIRPPDRCRRGRAEVSPLRSTPTGCEGARADTRAASGRPPRVGDRPASPRRRPPPPPARRRTQVRSRLIRSPDSPSRAAPHADARMSWRRLHGVRFGLTTFPTDYSIPPAELARAAEAAGFETLLFAEHTHIPVSRDTPTPRGGELPDKYWHTHDPFVALATVAQATTKLRFGTGVCLVVERDPITTAKVVASLDALSGGRVDFGVGAGWNREEMRNHGTDPRRRFSIMRERVLAMKTIWTEDEPQFHGEHVDFDPIWSWPKPVQEPHPPVLVGGIGEKVLDRVLDYGDEWMPNRMASVEELRERVERLRDRAGRHVKVSFFGAKPEAPAVERLVWAGVDRCVFYVSPDADPGEAERQLDSFAALA